MIKLIKDLLKKITGQSGTFRGDPNKDHKQKKPESKKSSDNQTSKNKNKQGKDIYPMW